MKYSVREKDRKKFEKRADIYDCIYRLIDCPDLTEFMLVIRVRGLLKVLTMCTGGVAKLAKLYFGLEL